MNVATTSVHAVAAAASSRRLLFVVNKAAFFVSHRLPIAVAARRQGFDVSVATPKGVGVEEIEAAGFPCDFIPLVRRAVSPGADAAVTVSLARLFRRLKPDIVHAVALKPVIYGGIAARVVGVPHFVAAISGLGYTFIERGKDNLRVRRIVQSLCRLALRRRNVRVIFQNDADRDAMLAVGAVGPSAVRMIRGSGVDLQMFSPVPERPGPPVVVLASRMLKDKGVEEFVRAAALVKAARVVARFVLVGDVDPGNPATCTAEDLRRYQAEGLVEWWGHRLDMAEILASAHIVVLPSYREGFPKVLMEAAAAGRAVVTTDVPGCRDAVIDGSTGLVVPARDAGALAEALAGLLRDAPRREAMGRAGRARAEREFGIERVVAAHVDVYRELGMSLAVSLDGVSVA